jgi:Toprim domain
MSPDDLTRFITNNDNLAAKFLTYVYPYGQLNNGWFSLGSFGGASGKSAAIKVPELRGKDHSTGDRVNGPISILQKARGNTAKQALSELTTWLEGEGVEVTTDESTADCYPWEAAVHSLTPADLKELTEFRGFPEELCERLVAGFGIAKHEGKWCFPIMNGDGAVVGVDRLVEHPAITGSKKQRWSPSPTGLDRKKFWYPLGCDCDAARKMIVTESRWDGISIFGGFTDDELTYTRILATSQGASQSAIIFPANVAEVVICAQKDRASMEWAQRIARLVPASAKLLMVTPGNEHKDFNDILRAGQSVRELLDNAKAYTVSDGDLSAELKPFLALPGGIVEAPTAAENAFRLLARKGFAYNVRNVPMILKKGEEPYEIDEYKMIYALQEVSTTVFVRVNQRGEEVLKREVPPVKIAQLLLHSGYHNRLPAVSKILERPSLIQQDGKLTVAKAGYYPNSIGGATYVLNDGQDIPDIPCEQAVLILMDLFSEFDFVSDGDRYRMLALILGPAMQTAGFLPGPYPMAVFDAHRHGSGKSSLMDLIIAIYGEIPAAVTPRDTSRNGGVGSFDNGLSAAFLKNRRFVTIDNHRGQLDSPLLETAITHEFVQVRAAYAPETTLSTRGTIVMLTSNDAQLTPDLTDRSIFVRLRGAPREGWRMTQSERNANLSRRQPELQAAVHAIIKKWHAEGCPKKEKPSYRFKDWAEPMCGVIEQTCGLPDLMAGMDEAEKQATNPQMRWAKQLAIEVGRRGDLDHEFQAKELADICQEKAIQIPAADKNTRPDQLGKLVGQNLGWLAREEGTELSLGAYVATLAKERRSRSDGKGLRPIWVITFHERSGYGSNA